jgi:hypothetical protein
VPRRTDPERGSTIPLIVGFAIVVLLLVAVVVDTSAAYLRRQGLDTVADGAALRGADLGASGLEVYADGLSGQRLRLTESSIRAAVVAYLRASGAYRRYPGLALQLVSLSADGRQVTVRIRTPVGLPLHVPGSPATTTVSAIGTAAVAIDR